MMTVEEKLTRNMIKNAQESHIRLDQNICRKCEKKICISVCPAHLYAQSEETGEVIVEYAGCLECGTCMIACAAKSVSWGYPEDGCGVQYRYG